MTCPFQSALLPQSSSHSFSSICIYSQSSSVVGTYTVRDDVGVAVEGLLGVTVLRLVTGQVPDDQSLVTGAGQEHVGAIASWVSKSGRLRRFCFSCGSYFSMEVAKLVTQPFCKGIQVSPTAHFCAPKDFRWPSPWSSASRWCRQLHGRKGWAGKLTWPSRVPLRMSCSAILKSSSTRYRSTKSRSGGSNGSRDGYGGAAIGLGKSRLEDFLESQRMETARKIWKCAHQNL